MPRIDELQDRCRRELLGDRTDPEDGLLRHRNIAFEVGYAVALRQNDRLAERDEQRHPGDPVALHGVTDAILEFARDHKVDLIAMATHGRTGIRRLVLGSIAESVVRESTIPTLLFPPTAGVERPQK